MCADYVMPCSARLDDDVHIRQVQGRAEGPPVVEQKRKYPNGNAGAVCERPPGASRTSKDVKADCDGNDRERILRRDRKTGERSSRNEQRGSRVAFALTPGKDERGKAESCRQHVREEEGRERQHERPEPHGESSSGPEAGRQEVRRPLDEQKEKRRREDDAYEAERPEHSDPARARLGQARHHRSRAGGIECEIRRERDES